MERILDLFYKAVDNAISIAILVVVALVLCRDCDASLFRGIYAASCFAVAYNIFARHYDLHC
jgi:uncharacterized membrane protein